VATKRQIEPHLAPRLLQPGPLALVTSLFRSQHNVMTAGWIMPMGAEPTLISVAIHPARLTHEFVSRSEVFGLSIPTIDLLNAVHRCGIESGRDRDKFESAQLTPMDATEIDAPLVDECVAHIECGLVERIRRTDHDLFIGEVLAASVVDELFSDRWLIQDGSELLHHIAGDQYAALSRSYQAHLGDEEE
jgi:flavin reductase (DIM6/NTAB) family NADH-FMN oxidoreductase RutF